MAGIKIVDLPPLGRDLASTDLLELSLAGGTGSRKITGQEIMNASKLSINNTPIINGTVGRVLFQGTGNVLQQSSSLFWDNTNLIFTLGSTATRIFNFRPEDTTGTYGNSCSIRGGNGNGRLDFYSASNITEVRDNVIMLTSVSGPAIQVASYINLNLGGSTRLQVASTTGNVLIGTTTDAGYKLDVNGSAIIRNTAQVVGSDNENVFTVSWGGSNSVSLGSNTANSPTLRLGSIRITAHPGGSSLSFSNGFLTTVNGGTNTNSPITLAPYVTGTSTGNVVLLSSGARISAHRHNPTSGTLNMVMVGGATANQYMDFSPASGNAEFNQLNILNQINTTGTYSGIVRGLYYNPILTSVTGVDHRAIETTTGNVLLGTTSGNVGIGTSSPAYKLHVVGSAGFSNGASGDAITILNQGFIQSDLIRFRGFASQFVLQDNAYNIKFVVSTSGSLSYFNTGGNVGINTTTDAGFTLDVNGTARVVTSILVGASSGTGTVQTGVCRASYFNSYNNNFTIFQTNDSTGNAKFYQGVSVGTSSDPVASAQVEIVSTTKGFLPPRMTQAQRNAIASPAIGLEIYQTDATEGKYIYKSSGWTYIG